MLKKTLILLSAALPLMATADEANESSCCPLLPPEPVQSCQLPAGYFYPAQYALRNCGVNISLAGEFLYWEVNIDSVEQIATKFAGTFAGGPGNFTAITSIPHNIGYKPGFRIAAGIGLPCFDNWDMNVEYTWYHHTTTKNFTASGDGELLLSKFVPASYYVASTGLRSVLTMNLNFLSATVGKSFYLSQRFIVNASAGLKTWWAGQEQNLYFNVITGAQGTNFTKSGVWGVGPYVTANVQALLACGFYLKIKAGVWTNYSQMNKFRVAIDYPAVPFPGIDFPGFRDVETQESAPWVVRMFYEGGLALGWGAYFCNSGYHVDLLVGYDMMTNYMSHYSLSAGLPIRAFYYQGLSVRAQLDF